MTAIPPAAAASGPAAARNHLLRNGVALVLNSAVSSLIGAGYWFVAAHNTSQSVVGQASALIAALMAIATIGQLSLPGVLVTYLPRAGRRARSLVLRSYGLALCLALPLGALFALVAPRLGDGFAMLDGAGPLLLFTASAGVWAIFALQDSALTGIRKAVWVPLENILYSAVKLGLLIALGSGVTALALLTTWVVPAAIALIPVTCLLMFRLLPRLESRTDVEDLGGLRRYFAGDSVGLVLSQISVTLLPVLVLLRLDTEAAGAFAIAWLLAQSLDLVAVNVGWSLTVEGAHDERRLPELLRTTQVRVLAIVVAAAAIAATFAPLILSIFGEQYRDDATTVLRLLLLGCIGRAIIALAICAARAARRPGRIVRVQASLAAIVPLGAWLLAGPLGLAGVGLAWAAGQLAVAAGVLATEPLRRVPSRR
jgi:O-antigen/teichoic acid export membrane protein